MFTVVWAYANTVKIHNVEEVYLLIDCIYFWLAVCYMYCYTTTMSCHCVAVIYHIRQDCHRKTIIFINNITVSCDSLKYQIQVLCMSTLADSENLMTFNFLSILNEIISLVQHSKYGSWKGAFKTWLTLCINTLQSHRMLSNSVPYLDHLSKED